jgi:hypothetical protein
MIASTAGFTAVINNVEAWVDARVTLTLPGGVYPDVTLAVESMTITAQTVSDLPDQARMQVGYPKITASFTLSGLVDQTDASKTAAWLFRRWNSASPLYRADALQAPVTIDVGVYTATSAGTPELIRKFTGFVDNYTTSTDGSVSFSCEDAHTLLRSVPSLPPVVTTPPFNAGLTSEYALDALLRSATNGAISTWPAQRAQSLLAAGMRASIWPEVGTLVTTATQPVPQFTQGQYGSGLTQAFTAAGGLGAITYQMANSVGTTLFVEFWVTGVFFPPGVGILDLAGVSSGLSFLTCQAATSGPQIIVAPSLGGPNFTPSLPIDSNPHYVSFAITLPAVGGTAWSATVSVDGVTASSGTLNFTSPRAATAWQYATVGAGIGTGTIQGIQVTSESAPTLNNGFVRRAVMDPSLNTLQVVPPLDADTDPWSIIQQIADAELAVAGFDESQIFRFYNRTTVRSAPIARTVTSSTSLVSLGEETLSAAVINRAQIGYTTWTFGAPATVWSLEGAWRAPRKRTVTHIVTTDSLITSLDATVAVLPGSGVGTAGLSYYRVSTTASGASDHPGITVNLAQISSNKVLVTLINNTSQDAYLVASADQVAPPAGTPVLWIGGVSVMPANEVQADYQYPAVADGGAASSRFGEVAWQASGNQWVQDADTAAQLGQDVVLDSYVPRPNLTDIQIIPDPRLQLTDKVHIQDPDLTGVDEYARIFGWTLNLSGDDWSMTIDARTLAPPGAWILGVSGRSELATTTYLQGV